MAGHVRLCRVADNIVWSHVDGGSQRWVSQSHTHPFALFVCHVFDFKVSLLRRLTCRCGTRPVKKTTTDYDLCRTLTQTSSWSAFPSTVRTVCRTSRRNGCRKCVTSVPMYRSSSSAPRLTCELTNKRRRMLTDDRHSWFRVLTGNV